MEIYNAMMRNEVLLKNSEKCINDAIKAGAYVYITLADGNQIHLKSPIQIDSIEAVVIHNINDKYGKAERINLNV